MPRPKPKTKIPPERRTEVIREYVDHCRTLYERDPDALSRKIPKKVFKTILDEVGDLLERRAAKIAEGDAGELSKVVQDFLQENPLPPSMEAILTPELRVYALLVHALRQWGIGEALATDRWLLSGNVRKALRAASDHCMVTGEPIGDDVELHHPVRDGRPPVPLSKKGHAKLEKQDGASADDPTGKTLISLRKQKGGSWVALWQGCCLHMGDSFEFSSPNRGAFCRSLANRFAKESGFSFEKIRSWIEEQERI